MTTSSFSQETSKTQTPAQISYASHEDINSSDNVCIILIQMVDRGFLLLDFNGSQYTFSRSSLSPMTAEEKSYTMIFGATPLVINGSYNPLLKEFYNQLKNQKSKEKLPHIKAPSKWIMNAGFIALCICFLSFKTIGSKLTIARWIEHQLSATGLIIISVIFGLIALGLFGSQSKKINVINKYLQKHKDLILFSKTLQNKTGNNLSDISPQILTYVMCLSKDWDEVARKIQNQPTLQPIIDLCSNNFKETTKQTLLK